MYLNKLSLKDFGKFNNSEIDLKAGVNLICVDSEAKRFGLKEFVVGMFYGINRFKGIEKNDDSYERLKSVSGKNASGRVYVKKDESSYFIERDFQKRGDKVNVLDIKTGRELMLKHSNNLRETFFDTDRSTYAGSLCITKPKAENARALSNELMEYAGNMTLCGSADINKTEIVEALKDEKRKYDTRSLEREAEGIREQIGRYDGVEDKLQAVREQIKEVEEEFAMETAKRKREARKLIETDKGVTYEEDAALSDNLDALTENSTFTDEEEDSGNKEEKLTDKLWFILLTGLFVIAVITAMVYILPFEKGVRQLFVVCTILFVIITIVEGLYAKGVFDGDVTTPSEEDFKRVIQELEQKKEEDEVKIDMSFAEEFIEKKVDLKAEEHDLLEDKRRKQELLDELGMVEAELQKMQKELHAINLAINTVNELSTNIQEEMKNLFTASGNFITPLSNGRYDDVRFEISGRVAVGKNGSYNGIDTLSYDDLKMVYMSMKLSAAKLLNKDNMPVVVEDWFTGNESFASNLIRCMGKVGAEQIILLTANQGAKQQLDDAGIEYEYIAM
ncbi:MAG: hypothetical protein NC393_10595 [Clostridium sp.]|nr:hypothetical protein [Clostridium sp.]MCM1172557.1 hypothetical protein [Clostridium sp.]MCM1209428.1 hypothetical protein [Ruminococcus sp.]